MHSSVVLYTSSHCPLLPLKTRTLLILRAHSLSKSNNYAVCSCVDVHSPLSFSFSTRFNEFSVPVFLSDPLFSAVGEERHLFLLIWGKAKGLMLNTTFPPLLAVTRIIDDGFTLLNCSVLSLKAPHTFLIRCYFPPLLILATKTLF